MRKVECLTLEATAFQGQHRSHRPTASLGPPRAAKVRETNKDDEMETWRDQLVASMGLMRDSLQARYLRGQDTTNGCRRGRFDGYCVEDTPIARHWDTRSAKKEHQADRRAKCTSNSGGTRGVGGGNIAREVGDLQGLERHEADTKNSGQIPMLILRSGRLCHCRCAEHSASSFTTPCERQRLSSPLLKIVT